MGFPAVLVAVLIGTTVLGKAVKLPDQHGPGVGVQVLQGPGAVPAQVQPDDRALHQVVGVMPVLAEQVGHPPQLGCPGRRVLSELGRTAAVPLITGAHRLLHNP